MGAKLSKSSDIELMENLNPARCCRLVYGPQLGDFKVENKWTLESTIQVGESTENTLFGVIGWKPSWKSGGFCGIQVRGSSQFTFTIFHRFYSSKLNVLPKRCTNTYLV